VPTYLPGPVEVSVPATSANLGPGFDSLGIALDYRDRVTAQVVDSGLEITVAGSGADAVPLDDRHLVYRAMCRAFEVMGCDPPGLRIHCENVIPHGRGMGSSSAAIVAGICAARGVVAGGSLLMDDDAVLTLATSLEGHPDNVAPAFLGGFTIAWQSGEEVLATGVTVDPRIHVVVFVPPDPVETTVARGLLPASVSHADAAANSARAALLVAALSRQPELLFDGTEDLLHQHYRESAMPHTLGLVRALRAARVPAAVSGAGPSVLAVADASQQEALAARAPAGWQALALSVDRRGTLVDLGG
jgi:homoserine kinase